MTKIQIGNEIGQGGFCIVHEATAMGEDGEVGGTLLAIKRLQAEAKQDEEIRHRFEREARLLDDILDHPNIVSVVYRNLSGDDPFFVMPRADESVADALGGSAGDHSWVCDVYRQVLDGMAYAHGKGVIHRDLKPENLLLEAGEVKLTDFGLGKDLAKGTAGLTKTSMWFGTEPYMPPEQFTAAHEVGPEADVFSLGKLLMVMLTGEVPEVGVPDVSEVPEQFRYFISRCCEKKPENRFGSAGEALEAFDRIVNPAFTETPVDSLQRIIEIWFVAPDEEAADVLRQLDELLRVNAQEESLYTREVPRLPDDLLDHYMDLFPEAFLEMLRIYDSHVSGGLPFEYCDVVADFYARIYRRTDRPDLRKLILERLFEVGYGHNRWHVQDVANALLAEASDASTVALAVEAIKEHPDAALWTAGEQPERLPAAIRDALVVARAK